MQLSLVSPPELGAGCLLPREAAPRPSRPGEGRERGAGRIRSLRLTSSTGSPVESFVRTSGPDWGRCTRYFRFPPRVPASRAKAPAQAGPLPPAPGRPGPELCGPELGRRPGGQPDAHGALCCAFRPFLGGGGGCPLTGRWWVPRGGRTPGRFVRFGYLQAHRQWKRVFPWTDSAPGPPPPSPVLRAVLHLGRGEPRGLITQGSGGGGRSISGPGRRCPRAEPARLPVQGRGFLSRGRAPTRSGWPPSVGQVSPPNGADILTPTSSHLFPSEGGLTHSLASSLRIAVPTAGLSVPPPAPASSTALPSV